MLETPLSAAALIPILALATTPATETPEFKGPSIMDFFPPAILFEGTPFELNRIMLLRLVIVALIFILFWLGTRKMQLVPGRFQGTIEMGLEFVRKGIVEDLLGQKDGKRFLPLITTIFFLVLFMNLTGIVPGINISANSVIGMPLVLAIAAYIAFIWAGLRKHPWTFIRNALFPPGVPPFLYIIVTPIEFVSMFVLRPVTLTLRLLMNMIVGHLLLVLFFSATAFFMVELGGWWIAASAVTLAFGTAFTFFEILVSVLQAYVFALLTTVYIQLALADEH
ncbi:F0F1 ATP synthase subunit A [Microcella frigidaquae]|uniref:ATP synthase subunit a n=1 Tax=Microcella frigidaquae TaxID=424758 RepID=A0A840X8D0_9MICO|nr:F-type H+-transporting ATPase subunit a [Microcella frigidaquae]NHN44934.1 F0F1 ATP synthase subunit A [Microcella frigidaquae]